MTAIDTTAAPPLGALDPPRRKPWPWPSGIVVILAVILLIAIVPPTLFLVMASLHTTKLDGSFDSLTLKYYAQILSSPHFATSLWNTFVYSIGSAVVAIFLGLVQALIVERTNAPGRHLVFLGAVISLGIPHVLQTVGWLLLFGKSGPVNEWFIWVGLAKGPVLDVYSMWGMILIEGVSFVPLTFLLMSSVLKQIDTSFEEAAMASGARPLKTFLTVTVPMCLPGVLALLLLVFIRAFESFEVPALVGLAGNINVLTTNIYQSAKDQGANFGLSGALSVSLLLIVIVLLYFYNQLSAHAHRYQTITGKGYRPRVVNLGSARWLATLVLFAISFGSVLLPVGMVVFASLQPFYAGLTIEGFQRLTLENYYAVLKPGTFRDAIGNTLLMAAVTATLVVPFTALCAWLAARRQNGAWFLDQLATVPLIFPGIVLSVAFLHVFVNMPIGLYGTLLSVILASAVRFLPYGMRYSYAGVIQIHPELEQASALSGARQWWTFIRIVLPLISAALISCWLFVFLVASREVSLPLMLVGPGTEIVGPTLFDLWQNGAVTELAAMGMLWVILMTFISIILHIVTTRYGVNARA